MPLLLRCLVAEGAALSPEADADADAEEVEEEADTGGDVTGFAFKAWSVVDVEDVRVGKTGGWGDAADGIRGEASKSSCPTVDDIVQETVDALRERDRR